MKKYNLIALFGKSGAGKDTLLDKIVHTFPQAKKVIPNTTRPKRDYEIEGIAYHFLTEKDFTEKVLNNDLIEATSYNGWFYGTDISELDIDKVNVGTFNLKAIDCLKEDSRLNLIPVYVRATDKTRLMRNLSREENPDCHEICRRFLADEKDFDMIDFEHRTIINYDGSTDWYETFNYILENLAEEGLI